MIRDMTPSEQGQSASSHGRLQRRAVSSETTLTLPVRRKHQEAEIDDPAIAKNLMPHFLAA